MHKILVIGLVLFIFSDLTAQGNQFDLAGIDEYVMHVMREFEVPGVSLAVVKDNQVILVNGYGVKTLGEADSVNSGTLFGIASNTKAFTAAALAILVEEEKLEWDKPVINYLPWFRLSDPYVTREITIRDLLVHRSGLGLGAGDLLWWPASTYDRKEIVRRLRFIPLETSFRSAYAYDNVLYTVAGEVIEAVSGLTWEEFVTTRILNRLGMNHSKVRHSASGNAENVATPHARVEGIVQVVEPFTSDNVNPAGGINSNAEDMAKWMIVQLDSGRLADGSQLFKPETTLQLWGAVTQKPISGPPPELPPLRKNFYSYALGFNIQDYRGKKLITHTGGLPGYVSRVAMIPDLKLGVAVLTNQESGAAFNAITFHILDRYLQAEYFDWIDGYKKFNKRISERVINEKQTSVNKRNRTSKPSLPLDGYTGIYQDAWYGNVEITLNSNKLRLRFLHTPDLIGTLEHWQYDTFVARWDDRSLRGDAFITFSLNPDGSIAEAKMNPFSTDVDFSFDYQDLLFKPLSPETDQ